jgi:hypothetical protein
LQWAWSASLLLLVSLLPLIAVNSGIIFIVLPFPLATGFFALFAFHVHFKYMFASLSWEALLMLSSWLFNCCSLNSPGKVMHLLVSGGKAMGFLFAMAFFVLMIGITLLRKSPSQNTKF